MAYEQGAATSKENLIDQFTTFLAANGWTLDEFNATDNKASVHLNDVFVHFHWDALSSGGIAICQSLGFTQQITAAVVNSGGTGYSVSDQLTVSGGTFEEAIVLNVDSESGGVITGVSIVNDGRYTVLPSNPVSVTGGGGSGATFDLTWESVASDLHLNDSGNGLGTGAINTERRLDGIGNGPYDNHWFFTSNEGGVDYAFLVLEWETGNFVWCGFGEMVKFGTWTGGEWCGGTAVEDTQDVQDTRHNFIMDGRCGTANIAATVHAEGLTDMGGSDKWGVCMFPDNPGVDGDGNDRTIFTGGSRDGFLNRAVHGIPANPNSGFIPMVPFLVFHRSGTSRVNWRFAGKLPHIRELNGRNLVAGEEFTIGGSEVWKVFPAAKKASTGDERTRNLFFAVRKIV